MRLSMQPHCAKRHTRIRRFSISVIPEDGLRAIPSEASRATVVCICARSRALAVPAGAASGGKRRNITTKQLRDKWAFVF